MADKALPFWNGFYLPSFGASPDLITEKGSFDICDDFDFENPKTDYDRACAGETWPYQLLNVEEQQQAIVLGTACKVAWVEKYKLLISDELNFDTRDTRKEIVQFLENFKEDELEWTHASDWHFSGEKLILMNSADHGLDKENVDQTEIKLEKGNYRLSFAYIEQKELWLGLLRFRII